VRARTASGQEFDAYEIHMGVTEPGGSEPFAFVRDGPEGMRLDRCVGTYLHGALQDEGVCKELGLSFERVDAPYNALAEWFEQNADTKLFEELYVWA
jgi:cobyric acid synthase